MLVDDALISTTYGRAESRAVKVEALDLVDIDVDVRTGERVTHIPSGVHKIAVTLNRGNGKESFELAAQPMRDEAPVQTLLDLVRALTSRLGGA
ncbi:hypothetical protein ABL57_19890 [Kocuria sp. SM24M-10]|nr:hypothetical protein ABL57_19890 [Kocuria sp. SM24M-10]